MNDKWAIVFDLDGTLLDTCDDLVGAINHMLEEYGYRTRSYNEIRRFLGNGARDLVTRSLPEGVDGDTLERFYRDYVAYYNEHSEILTKPYDGVLNVLGELRGRGIKTAVVSNKPDITVGKLCRQYFGGLVDFSVGDRPDIDRKPSADPINLAIRELGCTKAIYVGDSEVDVMAAANAGLPCISVTWGFRDMDVLEECGANIFANTADELKKIIYELIGIYDN